SPVDRILARRLRRSPTEPAVLVTTRQHELSVTNWDELTVQARRFGLGLIALGVEPGDAVGILGCAGPEAIIVTLGAMLVGVAIADLGDGSDVDASSFADSIERASCRLVICGEREHAESFGAIVRHHCGERSMVGWGAASSVSGVYPFGQVCLKGAEQLDYEPARAEKRISAVSNDAVALVIPDSRRDGTFRQVRLTHDNCIVAAESLRKSIGVTQVDRIAPIGASRGLVELVLLALWGGLTGASLVYAVGELSLLLLWHAARATILLSDGDALDRLHRDIDRELLLAAGWRNGFKPWARRVGNEAARRRICGTELGLYLFASHWVADRLVLSEQRRLLGGCIRRIVVHVSGMRRATRWFFESMGISPLAFVGRPESAGIGLLELPEDPRPGSFGRGMPGVDVWVDSEGRVRIRGANVARSVGGVRDEGWLDLEITGEIDEEGTIWPEHSLGALDAPSLAVLPIAEHTEHSAR
ncbi:MAG: AMP-binding protein, partial [Myxococcales bacterium]